MDGLKVSRARQVSSQLVIESHRLMWSSNDDKQIITGDAKLCKNTIDGEHDLSWSAQIFLTAFDDGNLVCSPSVPAMQSIQLGILDDLSSARSEMLESVEEIIASIIKSEFFSADADDELRETVWQFVDSALSN